jgi:hypothetical protein
MVRIPVVFLEKILEVAQYMDQNDGRLPFSEASEDLVIISGHPSESLSGEELKELSASKKSAETSPKSHCWGRGSVSQRCHFQGAV